MRRAARVGVVALPLVIVGCAVLFGSERQSLFSHRIHIADAELECSDCHRSVETSEDPGMPTLRQCMLCHQEKDAEKPEARRASTMFDAKGIRAMQRSALTDEIIFSHQAHVAKVTECSTCHQGIEGDDHLDAAAMAVDMDECMACHTKVNAANDCATCHKHIRREAAPYTHDAEWLRHHGKVVRAHSEARIDQCATCHNESSCVACHQDMPPAGHDNYFRRRGHGVIARMDRESCAACHRTDSCDRCHAEVRPVNHVGSWGSPRNTHCLTCHFPLGGNECATCHKSTPSHGLANPLPPSHTAGMNCFQCHGLSAPLPHVHKGDECARCHR